MEHEKQRERLVELIKNADTDKNLGWYDLYDLCDKKGGCAEYFADYLLANNVVVLPCKVGDTVFSFNGDFGVVLPYLVGNLNIGYMGKSGEYWNYEANCHDPETDELLDGIDFEIDDIGKTVFLSRAEAEKALKETVKNNGKDVTEYGVC